MHDIHPCRHARAFDLFRLSGSPVLFDLFEFLEETRFVPYLDAERLRFVELRSRFSPGDHEMSVLGDRAGDPGAKRFELFGESLPLKGIQRSRENDGLVGEDVGCRRGPWAPLLEVSRTKIDAHLL